MGKTPLQMKWWDVKELVDFKKVLHLHCIALLCLCVTKGSGLLLIFIFRYRHGQSAEDLTISIIVEKPRCNNHCAVLGTTEVQH